MGRRGRIGEAVRGEWGEGEKGCRERGDRGERESSKIYRGRMGGREK
mgnify:CR=1 FL=1